MRRPSTQWIGPKRRGRKSDLRGGHACAGLVPGAESPIGSAGAGSPERAGCRQGDPTIALAEIAYLYDRKRVRISVPAVLAHVARAPRCTIYSLDETVIERMPAGLNIHDALIVATALVFRDVLGRETTVVTRDAEITASGLVDVVW